MRKNLVPLIVLGLGLLSGCSSNSEKTKSNAEAVCEDLPPLAEKDSYNVGFAQLWEDHGPWRDANTASMLDEAKARGYDMMFDPGTNADPGEQVDRMQALIDAKVDVIFIAPHDETVLAPSVVAARRACIPTFIVDRGVNTDIAVPGQDYVSYLGSDFQREGELAAEWLLDNVSGDVKLIELEGTVGSSPAKLRKQGFDDRIKSETRIQLQASESGDFNEDKGHDLTLKLMKEFPDTNVIYSHNDAMSFGVITALEEMNLTPGKDVTIISVDGTKKATQDVIDGKIAVVVECNPKFGPIAFDTMLSYAKGDSVPLKVYNVDRVFDASNAAAYLPEAF